MDKAQWDEFIKTQQRIALALEHQHKTLDGIFKLHKSWFALVKLKRKK